MFDEWMWGMHGGWWIFWIAFIIVAVVYVMRSQTSQSPNASAASPLEILQRRYASGDISTEEYEERKARLERDLL